MVRKVISAVGLTIMCSVIYAQETPSPKSLERSMNSKVIDVIMRLEEVSDMSSGQDCREFLQLFESEDSPVVCDLFSSADFLKQVQKILKQVQLFYPLSRSSGLSGQNVVQFR